MQYLRRDEDSCRDVGASAVTRGGGSDLAVSDVDFEAKFDGGAWKVKWNWKGGEPPNLRNRIATYDNHMEQSVRANTKRR